MNSICHSWCIWITAFALLSAVPVPPLMAQPGVRTKAAAQETEPGKYVEEPTKNMDAQGRPIPSSLPAGGNLMEKGLAEVMAKMPKGTRHESIMMPLRDGVKLATDIFLPPADKGPGPWPVVLLRTQYSRMDHRGLNHMGRTPMVMVVQNTRGRYGSEGAGTFNPMDFRVDVNDGYDTVEWIAGQKWCNGKVGMWGPSGHGIAAINALWSLAPHLTAIDVNVTMDNAYLYIALNNGARRFLYSWLGQRGMKTSGGEWPRPTVVPYDPQAYYDFLREVAPKVTAYYRNSAGWFDVFSEAALDHFAALAPYGKAYVQMGPGGHGKIHGDLSFRARNQLPLEVMRLAKATGLAPCLTQGPPPEAKSCLVYYLMGDGKDPAAPGNVWMTSDKWPVDHTPTSYYMQTDGGLTPEPPNDKTASLSYDYDPRDPVPMIGGHHQVSDLNKPNIGPMDQRPNAGRKDILRFKTEPLEGPVGITGKVWVELYVSSDAPDTMFTAKLVDIYPDGYEAPMREGAILARWHQGLDKSSPLEKGKVYKLSMDLWSTALVFAKGHRIAVYVTSSSDPAYEVHPNTYQPVKSIDEAKVAHNTVHLSADHASRLILPVVARKTYINLGDARNTAFRSVKVAWD